MTHGVSKAFKVCTVPLNFPLCGKCWLLRDGTFLRVRVEASKVTTTVSCVRFLERQPVEWAQLWESFGNTPSFKGFPPDLQPNHDHLTFFSAEWLTQMKITVQNVFISALFYILHPLASKVQNSHFSFCLFQNHVFGCNSIHLFKMSLFNISDCICRKWC